MNKEVRVSVIMPSLNVANYISECIESVLNQSLSDIEIICVDAGSTDGTFEILKRFERKDKRIRVLVSDMKSYGYQVNLGFTHAVGEYVAIVETDDYIARDMYESLYSVAKIYDLDYIKGDFAKFKGSGEKRSFEHKKIVENDYYYNRVLWAGDELSVFNGSIYPWAGIYKRNFIIDNNIRLNETPGASYQDNGLCFQVYAYGKRGYFINREFYYLRREEQDASYYAPHKVNEVFVEFDYIYDFLVRSGFYDVFAPRFWKLKYQTFCWRAGMLADEHKLEFMQKFSDDFKEAFQNGIFSTKCFNTVEKNYLYDIIACPDLVCWKKYYKNDSVWQKKAVNTDAVVLSPSRISINGKKILIVSNELSYSGAPLSTLAQCKILMDAGAEVEVWSLKDGELREKYIEEGIKVSIVYPNEFERSQFKDRIREFDLAIICTILSVSAAYTCSQLIPTILYIRSDGKLIAHFLQKAITFQKDCERYYAIKNAKYIVAVSDYSGDWVKENINPNVYVINNFLEDKYDSCITAKTVDKEHKIKFLALGSIENRKAFDVYIDSFTALSKDYRQKCEIHFAGRFLKGSEDYYKMIMELANKTDGCFYHGEILDRDELYGLMAECDVIVVPSRSEACSRVAIEGAMLSKPLIVTEDVGAKYLVKAENGWIVETGSAQSLAAALMAAIDAGDNLNEMGAVSRRIYLETSTPEIYANNLIDYVERVLYDSMENNYKESVMPVLYSFDVFDTLVTRTTATPPGIFNLVQEKLKTNPCFSDIPEHIKSNFYDLRINAERLSRYMCEGTDFEKLKKNSIPNEDVTLEQIYGVFTFSGLLTEEQAERVKKLEIETEIQMVVPIPRNIDFVKRLLNEGRKVVAISDMYLSSDVIRHMLITADPIFENVPVYVSSELMLTKGRGNAYRKVRELENTDFENWHHTGDNNRSDFEIPKQLGMTAELYPLTWLNSFERYVLGDYYHDVDVQNHVAFARNARAVHNITGKAALGADLGTFLLLPYVDFILKSCVKQGIERLYFIARDGYVLQRIADILIERHVYKITTKYVYGSRKACRVFPKDYEKINIITLISYSNHNHIRNIDMLADVFSIFPDELRNYLPKECPEENIRLEELYRIAEELNLNIDFKKFISERSEGKRENMLGYFEQELDFSDDKFAFVELDGSGFTSALMSEVINENRKIKSPIKTFFYWALNTNLISSSHHFNSFFPSRISKGNIIECLCRAPHPAVTEYVFKNGEFAPMFENSSEGEALMKEGYGEYIYGVECASRLYSLDDTTNIIRTVERAFDYITKCPDEEILTFLGDIPFEVTGRSDDISRFAPVLTRDDIFNIYFLRHINREPIEKYLTVSYFDYCLMRSSAQDKRLMDKYTALVSEYNRKRKLQKLTLGDLEKIRKDAEKSVYGLAISSKIPPKPTPDLRSVMQNDSSNGFDVYSTYSWRIGHKIVLAANKIRNNRIVRKFLNLKPIKKLSAKLVRKFLGD